MTIFKGLLFQKKKTAYAQKLTWHNGPLACVVKTVSQQSEKFWVMVLILESAFNEEMGVCKENGAG